jgi:hypothetical protein
MATEKNELATAEPKLDVCNIEEIAAAEVLASGVRPDKGAINLMLVLSCLAFGASSFLFGYDDRVISPVAATPAFVSL